MKDHSKSRFLKIINGCACASIVFALASCSSTKKENASTPPQEPTKAETPASPTPAATETPLAETNPVVLKTIYFDFDKFDIRADQQSIAMGMADSLKNSPTTKIQIQGNTDERGSVEYNLALGEKRAHSLKSYLVSAGVNESNISTVSFGKEKPAVTGKGESAWSKNRRDDVVVAK